MRALEIQSLTGPGGITIVDKPEPEPADSEILVDVVSAGVAFPDLLQSRGLYQVRPEPPFVPGMEIAGVVRSAPDNSGFVAGDRVCALAGGPTGGGGMAEVAVTKTGTTFALPPEMSFGEGASFILNYQTAVFCMGHRGHLSEGESVLILGAAGGVGTSGIQVAKAMGAGHVVGLVSTESKAEMAKAAGADDVVLASDTWKDDALALTDGKGFDMVYDPVGGDRFLDGIRSLARFGRLIVVGFAAGSIPEIKVNRLLLRNVSVVGAAWGEAIARDRTLAAGIHDELLEMIKTGHIKPPIGATVTLENGVEAFRMLDERRAQGKVIIQVVADA